VSNSTFFHNIATGGTGAAGGGLNLFHGGTLSVSSCTFSENQAGYDQNGNPVSGEGYGGGISISYDVVATIRHSTFSGNKAFLFGGGFFNFQATLTVTNSTFFGTSATSNAGGGIYGGGLGGTNVGLTIIAGNTAPAGPDISGGVVNGRVTSNGYNLIGDT